MEKKTKFLCGLLAAWLVAFVMMMFISPQMARPMLPLLAFVLFSYGVVFTFVSWSAKKEENSDEK